MQAKPAIHETAKPFQFMRTPSAIHVRVSEQFILHFANSDIMKSLLANVAVTTNLPSPVGEGVGYADG